MWDEEDGFFYDVLHMPDGEPRPAEDPLHGRADSAVRGGDAGAGHCRRLPGFKRRMQWFIENRPDLTSNVACMSRRAKASGGCFRSSTAINFVAYCGSCWMRTSFSRRTASVRLSRVYKDNPYRTAGERRQYTVDYEPAESSTGLFGGNSNWRGPIWFPVNYLLIESLQKLHHYYGDDFKVECPTGSGNYLTLWEVSAELSRRLTHIFLRRKRAAAGQCTPESSYQTDPNWRDLVLFYEYFHGDDGSGVGASHQTGWTGLVAKLMQQSGE